MAHLKPTYSKAFNVLAPFAQKKSKAALVGFIRELDSFVEFWNTSPSPPDRHMEDDRREPATYQEELDAILMFAVTSCSEKSKMIIAAGASVLAQNIWSKRSAIWYVAKLHKPDLMAIFLQNKRHFKFSYDGPSELCGHAYVLDIAIQYNKLDMVKTIIDNVDIAECIFYDERWASTCNRDNRHIGTHPTAIVQAVTYNKPDIVEYLVFKGFDINSRSTYHGGLFHKKFDLPNHTSEPRAVSASECIPCTNRECYCLIESAEVDSSTKKRKPRWTIYPKPATLAQAKMPQTFASCNSVMFNLFTRLGAKMNVENPERKICQRGIHEYEESVMNPRRLAFSMMLHARLGGVSNARCLDEEVTRLILSDATPHVAGR
jgi:hypothetical protein